MPHRPAAYALLFLSAVLLLAGPYPCRVQAAAPEGEDCHEEHAAQGPALDSRDVAPAGDCCGNGSDVLCEHACQGAAVLAVTPHESEIGPAAELRALEGGHLLPPLARGLDHVPLA
ncbi:MAG: hypothetical protein ACRDHY_15565 [Anaerolineales bacterium]